MDSPRMYTIYELNSQAYYFSREKANELVGLLQAITRKSKKEFSYLNTQLIYFKGSPQKINEIQDKINQCINKWGEKMARLGAIPISLWKVKFPARGKCYIWEFPNDEVY